jgi:hypothetical protein
MRRRRCHTTIGDRARHAEQIGETTAQTFVPLDAMVCKNPPGPAHPRRVTPTRKAGPAVPAFRRLLEGGGGPGLAPGNDRSRITRRRTGLRPESTGGLRDGVETGTPSSTAVSTAAGVGSAYSHRSLQSALMSAAGATRTRKPPVPHVRCTASQWPGGSPQPLDVPAPYRLVFNH